MLLDTKERTASKADKKMFTNRVIASLVGSAIGIVIGLLAIATPASAESSCPDDMHWCLNSDQLVNSSQNSVAGWLSK
jgi:hypothetical protein